MASPEYQPSQHHVQTAVVQSKLNPCGASGNTVRRWILWFVFFAALVSGIVSSIVAIIINNKLNKGFDICTKKACIESSLYFKATMNETADPCEDFYKFTCGRFNKFVSTDDEKVFLDSPSNFKERIYSKIHDFYDNLDSNTNPIPKPVKLAASFYKSCLKTSTEQEDLTDIMDTLKPIGGWPLLNPDAWVSENWINLSIKAFKAYDDNGIFSLYISENAFDTTKHILILTNRVATFSSAQFERLFNIFFEKSKLNSKKESTQIDGMIKLYKIMNEKAPPPISDSVLKRENYMTIEELANRIPSVNWLHFFNSILEENPNHPIFNITENEIIVVNDITYINTLVELLNKGDIVSSTLANVIGWEVLLKRKSPLLSLFNSPHNQHFTLDKIAQMTLCVMLTQNVFSYAVDFTYANYIDKDNSSNSEIRNMIALLKASFLNLAIQSEWIDAETYKFIDSKLTSMRGYTDFPPWFNNQNRLENFYQGLTLSGNFDKDIIHVKNFVSSKLAKNFRKKIDHEWLFFISNSHVIVSAYYNPSPNFLSIPKTLRNLPYYDITRPAYLNFGALGSIIGHEITHGFDDSGIWRDEEGNKRNWWSTRAVSHFNHKLNCFINQFKNYKPIKGVTRDGKSTLSENMSDSGGIRQSFDAYKKWEADKGIDPILTGFDTYSADQLFFISYGSSWCTSSETSPIMNVKEYLPHPSNRFRVNAALSNFDKFSEAFKCKRSSKMVPYERCVIW